MLGAAHHISHEKKHTDDDKSTFLQTRLCRGGEEKVWRKKNQDGQEGVCSFYPQPHACISHPASVSSFTAYHSLPNRMDVVLGASLTAQRSRIRLPRQEMRVRSLGQEDSPGGGHGNPLESSCLENACGQRSLAGCSPGCRRVGHD